MKKILKNKFRIKVYNHYIVDLENFREKPALPINLSGFYGRNGVVNNDDAQFSDFHEYIKLGWDRISNSELNYKPILILSPENKISYYFFYTNERRISLKEFKRPFSLPKKNVYLNAERTIPKYVGLGIGQYGKRYLFHTLFNKGYVKAHFFVKAENKINNHISRKLRIPIVAKIAVVNIFTKKIEFTVKSGNEII